MNLLDAKYCLAVSESALDIILLLHNSEGFRAKATKGEAVVSDCEFLAVQDLESSGFPDG